MSASESEMPANPYESKQSDLRALQLAALIVPTLVVLVRAWSRALLPVSPGFKIPTKFWWDDWTVFTAAIINIIINGVALELVDLGLGRHYEVVPAENIHYLLKLLWCVYVLFDLGTALVKASAICFYMRVLGQASRSFRIALWTLHGLNILWLLVILLSTLFLCTPIEKNWNLEVPGRCLNPNTLWLGNAASGLFLDILVLLAPLPVLWNLQMKTSRKIQTTLVFLFAYIVVVVSIGRTVDVARSGKSYFKDPTFNFTALAMWLGSEIPVAIISVSLPSIYYLVQRGWRQGFGSLLTGHNHSRPDNSQSTSTRHSHHQKLGVRMSIQSQDSLQMSNDPQGPPITFPTNPYPAEMANTYVYPTGFYTATAMTDAHAYAGHYYPTTAMAQSMYSYPTTATTAYYGGSDDEYERHGIRVKSDMRLGD